MIKLQATHFIISDQYFENFSQENSVVWKYKLFLYIKHEQGEVQGGLEDGERENAWFEH